MPLTSNVANDPLDLRQQATLPLHHCTGISPFLCNSGRIACRFQVTTGHWVRLCYFDPADALTLSEAMNQSTRHEAWIQCGGPLIIIISEIILTRFRYPLVAMQSTRFWLSFATPRKLPFINTSYLSCSPRCVCYRHRSCFPHAYLHLLIVHLLVPSYTILCIHTMHRSRYYAMQCKNKNSSGH